MSKRQLSALLGFWVIIFLSLGFPIGWDRWVIAPVTGILIILVAYKKSGKAKKVSDSVFVQNNAAPVQQAEQQNHVIDPENEQAAQ